MYTDPKFSGSFAGKYCFLKVLKSQDRSITKADVEKALRSVDSYGLHRPLKRPQLFRRIYTKGISNRSYRYVQVWKWKWWVSMVYYDNWHI